MNLTPIDHAVKAVLFLFVARYLILTATSCVLARRSGASGTMVGALATTHLIGLAWILAAALAGGLGAGVLVLRFGLPIPPLGIILTQLTASLLLSWACSLCFDRYLSRSIFQWFSGEEVPGPHG